MNHQDFRVVNIGHGKNISDDKKLQHRIDQRKGNTVSLKKNAKEASVSKNIIESTESMRIEYCDGKEIAKIRIQKNIKQKALAAKLNIKLNIINDLERGKLVANVENKKIYNKIKQALKNISLT